eukprot:2355160-Pleurochrysis_carterae.AAC.1
MYGSAPPHRLSQRLLHASARSIRRLRAVSEQLPAQSAVELVSSLAASARSRRPLCARWGV